jgi:hypothetical protein
MDSIINLSFLSVGEDLAIPGSKGTNIYPNPASSFSTIEYSMQKMESVSVIVYNQTGQIVSVWDKGIQQAGQHKLKLELSTLPSGIYFCKLQVGDQVMVERVVKL